MSEYPFLGRVEVSGGCNGIYGIVAPTYVYDVYDMDDRKIAEAVRIVGERWYGPVIPATHGYLKMVEGKLAIIRHDELPIMSPRFYAIKRRRNCHLHRQRRFE